MARISTPTNTRHDNIARVAAQHAEAALCHYAHLNGCVFSDEQFETQAKVIRKAISEQLLRDDFQRELAAL